MEPPCLGRWSLLVRMAFALGGKKERVYRALLVPLPMPWHALLLTDSLPGALSSSEAHSALHGAAGSTRELTRPGGSIQPVMIWSKWINIPSFFNFQVAQF